MPLYLNAGIFLILGVFLCLTSVDNVQAGLADHVVINEVHLDSIDGAGGYNDDWVELYNPTGDDVILDGWSIQKHAEASSSSIYKTELNGFIPAGGYFLIVKNDADASLIDMADILSSNLALADNNTIYLVNNNISIEDFNDENVIDYVGMGDAEIFEGLASAPNPADTKSIARVSDGEDTDDNFDDFEEIANPTPQNSGIEVGDDHNLEGTVLLTITPNAETVQNIDPTNADIVFELNANGNALINYGLDDTYGEATDLEAVVLNTETVISLTGLVCGTTYHYSIYAENESGTANDATADATFTTLPCGIVVDSLVMTKSSAKANNEYVDGWEWEFNITVWDMNETSLKMKFDTWAGVGALDSGANMQFSVDGNNWIDILASDVYPSVGADISGIDNDLGSAGRQVQINVRMKLPVGTQAGNYNSSYGILTE